VRILLVEDNARVAHVVDAALRPAGHSVTPVVRSSEAMQAFEQSHFDVAIVDVGLPDGNGLDLCRFARSLGLDLPILLLTARNHVDDRVRGLEAGADDYLGKPFSTAELLARVRALSRRGPRWTESGRTYGALSIDRDTQLVRAHGERVPFTPREFEIVALLAWRDGRVVQREDVMESVWGEVDERVGASLDVLMTRIRRKLLQRGVGEAIRTVRQMGYAWALPRSNPA
jgi:DNA-binding response OmpR family regulator